MTHKRHVGANVVPKPPGQRASGQAARCSARRKSPAAAEPRGRGRHGHSPRGNPPESARAWAPAGRGPPGRYAGLRARAGSGSALPGPQPAAAGPQGSAPGSPEGAFAREVREARGAAGNAFPGNHARPPRGPPVRLRLQLGSATRESRPGAARAGPVRSECFSSCRRAPRPGEPLWAPRTGVGRGAPASASCSLRLHGPPARSSPKEPTWGAARGGAAFTPVGLLWSQ